MALAAEEDMALEDFDRVARLGDGGVASVTLVRHRRTGDLFALKEALCSNGTDPAEEAEVLRLAASSPSRYVVRCHAVFPGEGGLQASLLEYMHAGDLYDVLERSGLQGIPEPVLAEIAARCLKGLAQLHAAGIAHLDIKPDNFLVNSLGEIKISDFNTSRVVIRNGRSVRVSTTMLGTMAYFSPERFIMLRDKKDADADVATAADVWGLGLTILELFLGQNAILPGQKNLTGRDWMRAVCDTDAPSVPEGAGASTELRRFVAACLCKNPKLRDTVPNLLEHPFITRRDAVATSRALLDFILEPVRKAKAQGTNGFAKEAE